MVVITSNTVLQTELTSSWILCPISDPLLLPRSAEGPETARKTTLAATVRTKTTRQIHIWGLTPQPTTPSGLNRHTYQPVSLTCCA